MTVDNILSSPTGRIPSSSFFSLKVPYDRGRNPVQKYKIRRTPVARRPAC